MPETEHPKEAHFCDACFKSYQRRDLLLRHRRRCLRSNKTATRRKACNACVQAKTKCCYTQPTCSRCAKRGIPCEYLSAKNNNNSSSNHNTTTTITPTNTSPSSSISVGDLPISSEAHLSTSLTSGPTTDSMDAWSSHNFPWSLDMIDIPSLPSPSTNGGNQMTLGTVPVIPASNSSLSFALTSPPSRPSLVEESSIAQTYQVIPELPPMTDFGTLDTNESPQTPDSTPDVPGLRMSNNVRLILKYPKLLLRDDFYTPFLHRTLFNEYVPDMTILPHTSMAICCGSALGVKESARYVRRAMDTQRHSLIEAYPAYHCMEQWDALHAMLLYEILELGVAASYDADSWKRKPCTKGLKLPFLSKMTRCFSQSYPDSHDTALLPSADGNCSWHNWAVSETARRTIFLANIVNFFSNRDHQSGRQSPYYEPLNDDLILNMPLPCSDATWSARTEDEWQKTIQAGSPPINSATVDPFSTFGAATAASGGDSFSRGCNEPSLKSLFSKFAKDYIRANFATNVGFGDSNELRSFVILCALEQFP
ncbi:hypothetical protein BDV25DRAFT_13088 [Aspergillus avenaceus]|uniref:Zn(2)-C6 fungal-type domain-containing protein n=1 Tax=Aspergillus avenaceus TaxID=36643 RepID=A0A5N6TR00_ASPAV|nr:hypothetical protein BDV25DRAFT_13088 [Aspergillus avenaceus]